MAKKVHAFGILTRMPTTLIMQRQSELNLSQILSHCCTPRQNICNSLCSVNHNIYSANCLKLQCHCQQESNSLKDCADGQCKNTQHTNICQISQKSRFNFLIMIVPAVLPDRACLLLMVNCHPDVLGIALPLLLCICIVIRRQHWRSGQNFIPTADSTLAQQH